jgi:phosphoserine phosphatase RsbU/P
MAAICRTILAINCTPEEQDSFRALLASKQIETRFADSSGTLIQLVSDANPDCVVIDCGHRDDSIANQIAELRADSSFASIPVIIFSTPNLNDVRSAALRAGANASVPKPVLEEEFTVELEVQMRFRRLQLDLHEQLELNQRLLSRLQADLALGQQVQQSFLPPNQLRTENFSLDARLIAGGDLSGDYFDYKLITPERLAIFLADVSGHGVASALLASRLKAYFDENYRRCHRPRLFLEQLNRVLIDLGEHYHIATAVCIHIDVMETEVIYANAGHRTVYWLDPESGRHAELAASGPAMGMFDEFELVENTRGFLPSRNRIVTFTDGLVEFKQLDGAWITEETFRDQVILPNATRPLSEYVDLLLAESRRLTQRDSWDDDVSILALDF